MKYLPLIWSTLWRKKMRTLFTLLSIVIAFLLFGMLQGVNSAFNRAVELANVSRLVVNDKFSMTEQLPYSYLNQIGTVPGVENVSFSAWFGAWYQNQDNMVFSFPVDPERHFKAFTEFHVPSDQLEAFGKTRTGAVVGAQLAKKYNWKIGDRIPLHSTIWTKADGTSDWTFDLVGIFTSPGDESKENQFFFRYDYFDEARANDKGKVGWYIVQLKDPSQAAEIGATIDKLFANSSNETKTQSEKEFQQGFLKQIGDISYIVTRILIAVFAALLFATGSTMMQSVNERIPELAVLKTLGFRDMAVWSLVLAESFVLCISAAALGLACAAAVFPMMKDFVGVATLPVKVLIEGAAIAAWMAWVTGMPPALRARKLNIVDALAGR